MPSLLSSRSGRVLALIGLIAMTILGGLAGFLVISLLKEQYSAPSGFAIYALVAAVIALAVFGGLWFLRAPGKLPK
jgi:hypothetical protein